MSVFLDTSIQLAWAIANTEACLSGSKEIQPIHFVLGVLKLMDSEFVSQIDGVQLSSSQMALLRKIPPKGAQYLEMKAGEITTLRRGIRQKLRQGKTPRSSLCMLHRSKESKGIFASLAQRAVDERELSLDAMHLLQEVVSSGSIDLESTWKEVSGRTPTKDAKHRWSSGARWHMEDDVDKELPEPSTDQAPSDLAHHTSPPVIGRKKEMLSALQAMERTTKRNVLLVGRAGVGKRTVVQGLASLCHMEEACE